MHQRLYDLDLQLRDMGEAGIDQGMRPEQLVFASDYPQDLTWVNTDTEKGMLEPKKYVETVRELDLVHESKEQILGGTAATL